MALSIDTQVFPSAHYGHVAKPKELRLKEGALSYELRFHFASPRGLESSIIDLTLASERISIKCPTTLLPMKGPVTDPRCPHNFEETVILNMSTISDKSSAEEPIAKMSKH